MGKTRAEIQRDYRARKKKKLGDVYLEAERKRAKQYYIPADQLPQKKRRARNLKNKIRNQLSRARRRTRLEGLQVRESEDEQPRDSGIDIEGVSNSVDDTNRRLIVDLPALRRGRRANGAKKSRARALARAHKEISKLKAEKKNLERKLKTKSKQIERISKKLKPIASTSKQRLTPKRQTNQDIASLRLTPNRHSMIRKKLMLTNAVLSEVKSAKEETASKKRGLIHRILSGRTVRKYRCVSSLNKMTGLSRKVLGKCQSKTLLSLKEKRNCISRALNHMVEEFLSREDNCRAQPGKADVKKGKQTKVLTDYMRNLHQKFSAECPTTKMSLATFCRLRPKHILLAKFISRNACQCLKHQNMALKIQAMRKLGIKVSENPENICIHNHVQDLFSSVEDVSCVTYRMWKKVDVENKGKKMIIVESKVSLEEFIVMIENEIKEFSEHVSRLRAQYQQLKLNKDTLKEHQVIVQMDFAENYSCRTLDEVQTAYWSLTSVTLHPVVVYFLENSELKHKSFVVVSDTVHHSSSTVCAFLDALIPEIRNIDPALERIHYWTDSPSSQYRNRFIFNTVANHEQIYGCHAQWNYFEAGHGKSACDGLGGMVKRMADEASRQGNVLIQNAQDFFRWAVASTMKEVQFIYVEKETCEVKQNSLTTMKIKPVRNTMKLHALTVDTRDPSKLLTKVTSCYCTECIEGNFCNLWTCEKNIYIEESGNDGGQSNSQEREMVDADTMPEKQVQHMISENSSPFDTLSFGCYVLAMYDGMPYVGKVEDIDHVEQDCKISFMERVKELYRWPRLEDSLWVDKSDIICKLQNPQQTGKSKRLFKLADKDRATIQNLV